LNLTRMQISAQSFGKGPTFTSFSNNRCTVRRADGALQTVAISPAPSLLYKYSQATQWERCTKLCRFVKDDVLWAILATMAVHAQQLDTAEMALAAIEQVDKLMYIQSIKKIPSAEGRSAELTLYNRRPDDAEQILLQANLIYRAILLNIRIFRWDRALELAVKHKTHVDTVLAYRQRYLTSMDAHEKDKKFLQYQKEVLSNISSLTVSCSLFSFLFSLFSFFFFLFF
jgi:intraflagellar transport protein 80